MTNDLIMPQQLKILFVTVGLTVGGTEEMLLEILPRISKDKYNVSLCVLKGWDILGDEFTKKGIKVYTLNGKGVYDFSVIFKLIYLLRKEKFDIVHSNLYLANIATRIAGKIAGTPIIISSQRALDLWKKWYHHLLDKLTSHFTDKIITCSNAVAIHTSKKTGIPINKFITIYNGVDLEKFNPSLKKYSEESKVIGFIGRLDDSVKGISYLLQAFQIVLKNIPDVKLLIVGDGKDRLFLENYSKKLEIENFVSFTGIRRDLPDIIAEMNLLVLPSIEEGFGIVLISAMAMERPVVATNVGGIPEVVKDGESGILVPPKDINALSNAIIDLLENPAKAQTMGKIGRKIVEEKFSINITLEKMNELYTSYMEMN